MEGSWLQRDPGFQRPPLLACYKGFEVEVYFRTIYSHYEGFEVEVGVLRIMLCFIVWMHGNSYNSPGVLLLAF